MIADGTNLLSGSNDCELHLTRVDTGITRLLPGVWGAIVAVAAVGWWALSCDRNGVLGVWDLSEIGDPRLHRTLSTDGEIQDACTDAELTRFATVSADGMVTVGDLSSDVGSNGHDYLSARLALDARPSACTFVAPDRLVVGDASGRVHYLQLTGFHRSPL